MTQLIGLTAPSDTDVQCIISISTFLRTPVPPLFDSSKNTTLFDTPTHTGPALFLFQAVPSTVIYATPLNMSTRILPPFLAVVGLFVLFAAGQTDHPVRLGSIMSN